MNGQDDAKRLSRRGLQLADDLGRLGQETPVGAPTVLARTKVLATYPTTPRSFYACAPVTLLGTETEGGAGTLSDANATFFAYNLGAKTPPQGTYVVATFVQSRWVFRHDG